MGPEWIGFAGGIIALVVSTIVGLRQGRDAERLQTDLARLSSDLEVERAERLAMLDRRQRAEDVLTRYREPLAAAAFDLQSRLYNILKLDFLTKFGDGQKRFPEARTTTAFRFAQYFGWTEILRRDIQFLSFPEAKDTQRVAQLQRSIAGRLATSGAGEPLMIWTDEQRAIGERMIVMEHEKVICMGYARFCDEYDANFAPLCAGLLDDLADAAAAARLRDVQNRLCELVETLDTRRDRYTEDLERA